MSDSLKPDPLGAWQRLRAGNERFTVPVRAHRGGPIQQRPVAAVFRCADAGMAGEIVFGQSWGSLIDVSTWGHAVDSGVMATLEHAVSDLEVPLIVVLGHQGCDAMRMAMRAWDEAVLPDGATRTVVEHAIASIARRSVDANSIEAVTSAHIVETGLALLQRSPIISRRVDAGECAIVCATTSPVDGKLQIHATVGAVGEVDDSLLECV
ncbi:MAG: carbonic anhydrase [Mycobacterium sp.]